MHHGPGLPARDAPARTAFVTGDAVELVDADFTRAEQTGQQGAFQVNALKNKISELDFNPLDMGKFIEKLSAIKAAFSDKVMFHRRVAITLVGLGAAIVSPGFKDAALSYLNRKFQLGLNLDAPIWLGAGLILLGVLVLGFGEYARIAGKHSQSVFLACRHQSFEPLTGKLTAAMLPKRFRHARISHLECDLSAHLSGGVVDPVGAVRQQARFGADLLTHRRTNPETIVGYYGIVHVPLQFLAGCSVSTWSQIALFEHVRNTEKWQELGEGEGPDLGVTVKKELCSEHHTAVVVRIAISYEVALDEIIQVVSGPFANVRIAIAHPKIDSITTYGQVEKLARAFREVLDEILGQVGSTKPVHVFYAGPVSLGFSLGRQISRTLHPPVTVYNYTARANPAYAWGVLINGNGSPDALVVRPALTASSGPNTP